MWSGTIAQLGVGELSNWRLCDGTNGTPDLRSRFIVGAGTDTMNVWGFNATTGAQTFTNGQTSVGVGSTGGKVAHKLIISEMPSHQHTGKPGTTPAGGGGNQGIANDQFGSLTGAAGGDEYHENRPPYYALAFIMRVS
jgi:microcystin-dependent protein